MLKLVLRYVLAWFFVLAGLNHFLNPAFYLRIMPPYLPWHLFIIYLSGVCEMSLGVLLLIRRYRRNAAWGMIGLLIAVSPVHLHMANHPEIYTEMGPLILWLRLPLQGVIIAWAYWYTISAVGERSHHAA
jgi:uncharacterized membrane protein